MGRIDSEYPFEPLERIMQLCAANLLLSSGLLVNDVPLFIRVMSLSIAVFLVSKLLCS